MHYKHYKHMHVPDSWEQYWSKYPNGYTVLESLMNWLGQVNEMTDSFNHLSDDYTVLNRNMRALEKELRMSWNGYKESTTNTYTDFRDEVYTIINNWIATIEPTIQDEVSTKLNNWLDDGTLADIINNDVFNMKANQTDLDVVNTQLQQNMERFTNEVHMSDFPRLPSETDDTGRLQRAIDSFDGNIAGAIHIAGDLRISAQVTCNKTGLRLVGVNNRKSRIICTHGGIGLFIKPLYNGNPFTSISYCKFYMDNIAVVAEGEATVSGTGLWLQWIYASSFTNLYTSGFAKHIVLKGAHLNTFYNLYQGNKDSTDQTLEIHNRGVGLSADYNEDETGESTSNNNHIVGGWINNCHWDLSGMDGTITSLIDIEPASGTFLLGNGSVFKDCRFERMNIYSQSPYNLYPNFPWFILGNNCRIINCNLHLSGASADSDDPIFQVNGNFNEIELDNVVPYNQGLVSFGDEAEGNTIVYKGLFNDYQRTLLNPNYKQEYISVKYNNKKNRIIYKDNIAGTITDVVGSHTKAQGEFLCVNSKNVTIVNSPDYTYQGVTSNTVDIPLPIGRETGSTAFTKLTVNTNTGNRRMLLVEVNGQTAPKSGVYTLSATVYIPALSSVGLEVGATLNSATYTDARNTWLTVRSRVYLNEGEKIMPTFQMLGVLGDVFYVGEISVCQGNTSVYIPNDTYEAVSKAF